MHQAPEHAAAQGGPDVREHRGDPASWFPARVRSLVFAGLPILAEHVLAVGALPDHHRDPFDRLLLAQAVTEPLHLLTTDESLKSYSSLVIVV